MNERDWADRFNRDVNGLLNVAWRTDSEPAPAEYHQALDLARTLATADFSTESQVRQALRHRLLNQVGAREGWPSRKEYAVSILSRGRRPALIFATVVLTALLVAGLVWPEALATAAQGIRGVVQRTVVGPHTQVVQIEPRPLEEPPAAPSDMWSLSTVIGGFGGNVPPGMDATVHTATDLEKAESVASFQLRAPGYLPSDYTLHEIKLVSGHAFLFYGGDGRDIILSETWVGPQPSDEPYMRTGVYTGWFTDGPIEKVDLNGHSAAWVNNHILAWETGSVSYSLGGLDLTLDVALRIAESLE